MAERSYWLFGSALLIMCVCVGFFVVVLTNFLAKDNLQEWFPGADILV